MATRPNPDAVDAGVFPEVIEFLRGLDKAVRDEEEMLDYMGKNQHSVAQACGFGVDATVKPIVYRHWPWPDAKEIVELKLSEKTTLLYKFLCCKHAFGDRNVERNPNAAARAWAVFEEISAMLLRNDNSDLPNALIWEFFDELMFQLSLVYQKRMLKKNTRDLWTISNVTKRLKAVVDGSGILKVLEGVVKGAIAPEAILCVSVAELQHPELASRHQAHAAGLFAIVTLFRLDVLLADFSSALRRLECLSIPTCGRAYFSGVGAESSTAAHISLFYNIGFCYVMMRRYVDAAGAFRTCLAVKAGRSFAERIQIDSASLYSIATVLGGFQGEDVGNFLHERHRGNFDDELRQLSSGQHEKFREVFSRSSPKFISIPLAGSFNDGVASESKELQTHMFMREVMQQLHAVALRGYFQVYRTISAEKINSLLSAEASGEELDGTAALLSMKHKSKQLTHDGVSADLLSGSYKSSASLGLLISGSSVEVIPTGIEVPVEVKQARAIAALASTKVHTRR